MKIGFEFALGFLTISIPGDGSKHRIYSVGLRALEVRYLGLGSFVPFSVGSFWLGNVSRSMVVLLGFFFYNGFEEAALIFFHSFQTWCPRRDHFALFFQEYDGF